MTVKNLISQLSKFDGNMDVFVRSANTDFMYAPVESVYDHNIKFMEEPTGKELARETVVIIDEEI